MNKFMLQENYPVVIIGAGPAGLTAAYELLKRGIKTLVLEKTDNVGGLSRTETYKGFFFDIGGHRFYTKIEEVQRLWQGILKEKFIKVVRLSRIYYRGQFFKYPLDLFNTLSNLGFVESLLILLSYFKAQLLPYPEEKTFEEWIINHFGKRLYQTFFKAFTEKVWGIPCNIIQADWAAQRIKGLSLKAVVSSALFGTNHIQTLINEFHYPTLGPGIMWHRFQELVEHNGGKVHLNTEVIHLKHENHSIREISVQQGKEKFEIRGKNFISTMPLHDLIIRFDPQPPTEIVEAAHRLTYRAFILVGLMINRPDLFPDQWIYVHNPEVKVGRIQNFKNYSAAMVPDPDKTGLGMEYFCTEGDEIWSMSDAELIELAIRELVSLEMAKITDVEDGIVFRQPKAYPVYDSGYREHLRVIKGFLKTVNNLQTIGRNGLHRYNNQDHSMLTARLAVENILGSNHNLWELNKHLEYHE